jgi:competence protein ComEC
MPPLYHKKEIVLVLIIALGVVGHGLFVQNPASAQVAFLDVGQGDAILISLPGGEQILVDGGPGGEVLQKLPRYMPFYDRRIELLVLSHPHADHLSGLNAVLRSYEVENVLLTGVVHDSGTYRQFLELIEAEDARVFRARPGDTVRVGGETLLSVIAPLEDVFGRASSDINQTSVVMQLSLGGLTFLLTGDADRGAEEALLRAGQIEDIDVLKVVHQGSRYGTSPAFLAAARPEVAVIEVGKNSYGHPSPETLERLSAFGTKVFRTDESGDMVWRFKLK